MKEIKLQQLGNALNNFLIVSEYNVELVDFLKKEINLTEEEFDNFISKIMNNKTRIKI